MRALERDEQGPVLQLLQAVQVIDVLVPPENLLARAL